MQQTHNPEHYPNDEISLIDIFKKLWLRRGLLVILPIVTLLLAVVFIFLSAVKTTTPTVYFVQLNGIEKSSYPNGARFSPQDLLIPEVLEHASAQLGLDFNDKLRQAIQVEYGMPTSLGLSKKYQKRLSAKGLTATEIDQINKEYEENLSHDSQRGLRISINHSDLGLNAEEASAFAYALPSSWSYVYSTKYRVLIDTSLNNISIIKKHNPLEKTSDILAARNSIRRMNQGLTTLSKDNRLQSIVSESNLNSEDLKSSLQLFEEIYFRPLLAGLFNNPDQVANSFIIETQLQIDEINVNLSEFDRIVDDIRSFRLQTGGKVDSSIDRESVQLGDNTIQQIIDLANQASLSDYLQRTLSSRRELAAQKASLETELSRSNSKLDLVNKEFLTIATDDFKFLKQEYTSLLKASRGITRNSYGDFYQPIGEPEVIGGRLPDKTLMIFALAVSAGITLSMVMALILPYREKEPVFEVKTTLKSAI